MIWFVITDEEADQTPQGKGTNREEIMPKVDAM